MHALGGIDPLAQGRAVASERDRARQHQKRLQRERESGYQHLAELCAIGESDTAARLASQHPAWGYEVVAGEILERH